MKKDSEKKLKIERKKKTGLVLQIDLIVALGIILINIVVYFSQNKISSGKVKGRMLSYATETVTEMTDAVQEYPAYSYLLRYWYEHRDELTPEYDVNYRTGTRTEEMYRQFSEAHPGFLIPYATEEEVKALSEEDQRVYAEIVYSWLIMRINEIKQNSAADFLFCILTDTDEGAAPYQEQVYLLSGADPGSSRGKRFDQVYVLGSVNHISENSSLQNLMREAVLQAETTGESPIAVDETGKYADYYKFLDSFDGHAVLAGMSFDMKALMADIRQQALNGTFYSIIYQLLLLQIVMVTIFIFGISPLQQILQTIREYTEDKDSRKVAESLAETLSGVKGVAIRHNEIGQLAEDVMYLAKEIDDYMNQIENMATERERVSAELHIAAGIQRQMVPEEAHPFQDRNEFQLHAFMRPAREVGGDFYDHFMTDEDHLVLVIADVSGKGIPAALFMMMAKTLIKTYVMAGMPLSEAMQETNVQLCENNEMGYFVTVWLASIELSTGKITVINAGHEHPALCRSGGRYELVKYKHSMVAGMMPTVKYTVRESVLYPGDRIFVYTDGVPEATSKEKELFGEERLLEVLNQNLDAPLEEIPKLVRTAVDSFTAGEDQFDDITMMVIRYDGKP
ncbi:MAG: serine/threonine-protein phosphatase [Solobacterium sp.]|nr:serine/threonine-protein phosphatase [Solobacterium sp.]